VPPTGIGIVVELLKRVLVRYVRLDKEKGHKLEPKWFELFLIARKYRTRRAAWLAAVTNPDLEVIRRHVHHLRVYYAREERIVRYPAGVPNSRGVSSVKFDDEFPLDESTYLEDRLDEVASQFIETWARNGGEKVLLCVEIARDC